LCGCSGKPSASDNPPAATAPAAPAKPQFDFGTLELVPKNGSGKEATLHLTFKGGSQKPVLIGLLIKDQQNGSNACYAFHNMSNHDRSLVTDAGVGATSMGERKSVANNQCELVNEGSVAAAEQDGITATFHIRFRPAFRGPKHIWVVPEDGSGNGPQMQAVGDWTVQ
jgi:hypothetical protein